MTDDALVPFLDLGSINGRHMAAFRDALERVATRAHWVLGPELEAFEREFAAYCGTRHAIGVANGLDALELTLRAWDVGHGDEVLVPSRTFVATWMAVTLAGATPRPVACDEATQTMDPKALEAAVTARTRAVIPVHLYGRPADMSAINAISRARGLHVLEDAAQAHGARIRDVRVGALGEAGAFSFYPAKNLGALGDGGAVTTNDDRLANAIRQCRNYGSTQRYLHERIGRNSRLDELQAAFLRVKLPHLDSDNARRATIASRYSSALSGLPGLTLPPPDAADAQSVWHLYVVRHAHRAALAEQLSRTGVACHVHYPWTPGQQPPYTGSVVSSASTAADEAAAQTVLSLPIGPTMTDEEVDQVCDAVRQAVQRL